ncbi:MAG: hypothetical protein ACK53Y_02015 [bacterium]
MRGLAEALVLQKRPHLQKKENQKKTLTSYSRSSGMPHQARTPMADVQNDKQSFY